MNLFHGGYAPPDGFEIEPTTKQERDRAIRLLSLLYFNIDTQWRIDMRNGVTAYEGTLDEGEVVGDSLLGEVRRFLEYVNDEYVTETYKDKLPF